MKKFETWTHYSPLNALSKNIKISPSDPLFGPKNQNGQNWYFGPRREKLLSSQSSENVRRERVKFQMGKCEERNVTFVTLWQIVMFPYPQNDEEVWQISLFDEDGIISELFSEGHICVQRVRESHRLWSWVRQRGPDRERDCQESL